jgi:lipid A 3-O-deacylase
MAPYRAAVMVSGLLCAAFLGSPSCAADLGVQTPSSAADLNAQTSDLTAAPAYFTLFQELRVGAFAHNLVHNENAPVDLSFETISSNIGVTGFSNPFVAWFLNPRVNFGAMINVEGKTSYAFGGFNWHAPIYGPVFFEGEFGGEVNDGVRAVTPDRVDLGCVATFRESGGFGVELSPKFDVILSVEHISHAGLCGKQNPGITDFGFRVGYKF